jgi:hypothetical protein
VPAIATITVNDGAGTPVAHAFAPVTTDGSAAAWANRAAAIPAGFEQYSQEVLPPSGNRTTYKVTIGFKLPTVAEVDGTDKVVRYNSGQLIFNFHPESTTQEREDAHTLLANWLANSSVKASIENLEPFY